MKQLILKICLLSGITLFFGFFIVQAQTTTPETITPEATWTPTMPQTENFDVEFSPEHPGANTRVTAQVISYTFDVNRSTIAWIINGKVAGSGKTFSFTTGELGSKTGLTVSVITADEKTLSKSFIFQATEVDLLWETPSYAPPPYRGKALAPPQASIKVIAFPQGVKTAASRLIYEWRRNAKNLPNSSGQGRNTLTFYASETGDDIIEISVSTPDGNIAAENSVRVKVNEPKILFYEEHPLEGPQYQKELSSFGSAFLLEKSELILRAEPYFFSKRALPILSYEWQMNNKKIETPQKPNLLNLVVPSGQKGTSIISLSLENLKNILERANRTIQINFNVQ